MAAAGMSSDGIDIEVGAASAAGGGFHEDADELQDFQRRFDRQYGQEEESRTQSQMHAEMDRSKKAMEAGKRLLKQMQAQGAAFEKKGYADRMPLFTQRYEVLCHRFVKVAQKNQAAKGAFKDSAKKKLLDQAELLPGLQDKPRDVLEAELERDPTLISQAVAGQVVAHREVRRQEQEAQDRAEAIRELMQSIQEVAQMVNELAELTNRYSEVVDKVVVNVRDADQYVKQGNSDLRSAIESQKASRKKMCCLAIVGIVVLVLISGVLGGVLPSLT